MITVFGEGRGFRVVWLLEEMGLPYRVRPVDLLAGVEKDPEFLAGVATLDDAEQAYVARTTGREAYARAMDACQATKAWAAEVAARSPGA